MLRQGSPDVVERGRHLGRIDLGMLDADGDR
jgi:hypothetical protein